MGGDARLTVGKGAAPQITASELISGAETPVRSVRRASALSFSDVGFGTTTNLGAVDIVDLSFESPLQCLGAVHPTDPNAPFTGEALTIAGNAKSPIQRKWRLGPLVGPRTTTSWPLVGTLPGAHFAETGAFRATSGLAGDYFIPASLITRIGSGGLTPIASVEEARPSTIDESSLDWAAIGPLQPTARVANTLEISRWSAWQLVGAILLGIAGSILATLLLDFVRTGVRAKERQATQAEVSDTLPYSAASSLKLVLLVLTIFAARRVLRPSLKTPSLGNRPSDDAA